MSPAGLAKLQALQEQIEEEEAEAAAAAEAAADAAALADTSTAAEAASTVKSTSFEEDGDLDSELIDVLSDRGLRSELSASGRAAAAAMDAADEDRCGADAREVMDVFVRELFVKREAASADNE